MIKSSNIVLALFTLLMIASCSKKPIHTSKTLEPQSERPEAGSIEWIDRLQYNDDYKLAYGVFNDQDHLVMRTMTKDRGAMMKLFAAGFTIGIDTTGKKTPQFLIDYPLPQGMRNMPSEDLRPERQDIQSNNTPPMQDDQNLQRLKTALNNIELTGFSDEAVQSTTTNSRDGDGISAWIFIDDQNTFYYELSIPMASIFPNQATSGKIISVKFETGEMDMPERQGPPSGMSMGPGGGGGGRGGGGGGHGQGGGRSGGGRPEGDNAQAQNMWESVNILLKRIQLQ